MWKGAVVLGVLALVACSKPAPTVAEFQQACAAYGFQAGTEAMAQCVQMSVESYNDRAEQARMAIIGAGLLAQPPVQPRYTPMPVTTCVPTNTAYGGVRCW